MRSFIWKHLADVAVNPLLLSLLILPSVFGEDWPHWRGPTRDGISKEKGWLDQWPGEGPPIAWKAHIGLGYSSFVIGGGRAYTLGFANNKDTLFCFDAASGKTLWQYSYPSQLGDKYFQGGTTGTPTLEGDRLYLLSRWGDLFCFGAAAGEVIWKKNIHTETRIRIPDWGYTGAPLVFEDLLVLNVGDAGLAVDKATGRTLWRSADKDCGYSTPLPMQRDGKWLTILASRDSYVAVEPRTGKEAWRVRWNTQYGVNAADPIISGDLMFLSTGYGKGAGLFKLNGRPQPLWTSRVLRTQLNPAILYHDHVYGPDGDTGQKAPLKCVDLSTGTEKWAEPAFGTGGVIIADGKLIAFSAKGELIVAAASPDGFKPSARAQILGGESWTAPVLANGRVYCRNSLGDVACVDLNPRKPN